MDALVQLCLSNALVASGLALLAVFVGKLCRRPALSHALWLLVLLKLVTPPLIVIPVAQAEPPQSPAPSPPSILEQPIPAVEQVVIPSQPNIDIPADPATEPFIPRWKFKHWKWRRSDPQPLPKDQIEELLPSTAEVPAAPVSPVVRPEETWKLPDVRWLKIAGVIWLGGSGIWFAVAFTRIRRFQRVLRMGKTAPPGLQKEAAQLAARMGLRDCPAVWLVPGTVSPLLWAVAGYPKLLLPAGLLTRLDDVQRRTLLVHELAHYRRRDHWVRFLEFFALGLYWWFPVAWWARRELREAEEECCDGWVLWTLPEAAKAYASALVETLDFLSGCRPALPPVASGLGQLDLLRRRLTMIMRGNMPRELGGLGLLAVVALGVLLLPMLPSWAQQSTTTNVHEPQSQPEEPLAPRLAAEQDVQQAKQDVDQRTQELKALRQTLADLEVLQATQEKKKQPGKGELDKAKKEVEQAAKQLDEIRASLKRLQSQLDERQQVLKAAQSRLKAAQQLETAKQKAGVAGEKGVAKAKSDQDQIRILIEKYGIDKLQDQIKIVAKQVKEKKAKAPKAAVEPPAIAMKTGGLATTVGKSSQFAFAGGGDMDKRMANLEWKVDQILREITEMRQGKAGAPPKAKKSKGAKDEDLFPKGFGGDPFGKFGGPGFPGALPGQPGSRGGKGGDVDNPPTPRQPPVAPAATAQPTPGLPGQPATPPVPTKKDDNPRDN